MTMATAIIIYIFGILLILLALNYARGREDRVLRLLAGRQGRVIVATGRTERRAPAEQASTQPVDADRRRARAS